MPLYKKITIVIAALCVALGITCLAYSLTTNSNTSEAADSEIINPETGIPYPDHIVNGDFEYAKDRLFSWHDPKVVFDSFGKNVKPITGEQAATTVASAGYRAIPNYDQKQMGWYTNYNNPYEILQDTYSGNCCGSVLENLHQDIVTIPGAKYKWSLRACSLQPSYPVSSLKVLIGAPGSETAQQAHRDTTNGNDAVGDVGDKVITNCTGKNIFDLTMQNGSWVTYNVGLEDAWETYSGEYTIPDGQTITRFTFANIDPAGNASNKYISYIDDVQFSIACPITYIERIADGDAIKENVIQTIEVPAYTSANGVLDAEIRHADEGYSFKGYKNTDGNNVDMSNITEPMTIYLDYEKDPLPIEVESSVNDEYQYGSAIVSWPQYNYKNKNFKVYQSADDGATWNSVGIDYRDVKEVRCLQIYPHPDAQNQFKSWIENTGYGQGIIHVDSIYIDSFNVDPDSYLKDVNSNYKYDVIVLGTWNGNNYKDLSYQGFLAMSQWIKSGRGTIFGHDTIAVAHADVNMNPNSYMNQLSNFFDISVEDPYNDYGKNFITNTIQIDRTGLLTNYPNYIGTTGTLLTIPTTHQTSQTPLGHGKKWILMAGLSDALMKDPANFYLYTYNNCAMIQTGHSDGQATSDEQKVLANLIFYMNQLLFEKTTLNDASAQDIAKPAINFHVISSEKNSKITLSSEDFGTTYKYKVESYLKDDTTETGKITTSNEEPVTVTTGVKTYKYLFDSNADTKILDVNASNLATTDASNDIDYTGNEGKYMHVVALDGAGNVSETYTLHTPAPVIPSFDVTKVMTDGTSIGDSEFSFSLYDASPVGYDPIGDALSTTTCDSTGYATLSSDATSSITAPGIYTYAIKENSDSRSGIRFDPHVEGVMVTAADNRDGTMQLEYTYDMHRNDTTQGKGILFENVRIEEPLYVEKIATGTTSTFNEREYEFTFNMKDTNGLAMHDVVYHRYAKDSVLSKLVEIASGTIDDGETFTMKSGERYMFAGHGGAQYSISENVPAGYTVEAYDESGTLETNAWTPTTASFYNTYSASGAPDEFSAIVKNDMFDAMDGQYEFTLSSADGAIIESKRNDGGNIPLSVPQFTQADDGKTFEYEVKQTIPDEQGSYIYDDEALTIKVTVHDNGDGTLSFDTKYSKGATEDSDVTIPFVNRFSVALPGTGMLYASTLFELSVSGLALLTVMITSVALRKRRHEHDGD